MYVFPLKNACCVVSPDVNLISVSWYNERTVVKSIRSTRTALKNLVLSVRCFPYKENLKSNTHDLKQRGH